MPSSTGGGTDVGGGDQRPARHSEREEEEERDHNNSKSKMKKSHQLVPHALDSDILNPSYKLLSDVRRTPAAVISGKGRNYGGGALSLDGTIMSSHPNQVYGGQSSAADRSPLASSSTTSSGRGHRVPQPPGPGAYVMPSLWTPTKGPVRWRPELYPVVSTPRGGAASRSGSVTSARNRGESGADTGALYLPPTPSGKAFSMSSRWDGQVTKHAQLPGPGSYDSFKSDFSPKKEVGRCVFGLRPPPPKSPREAFPGPGAYEVGTATPMEKMAVNGSSYKVTTLSGKWTDPTPPHSPHALSYRVPGHFDKTPTGGVATIKGRLAHPMDSKDISLVAAKTDHPRDPSKRMKMRPVA